MRGHLRHHLGGLGLQAPGHVPAQALERGGVPGGPARLGDQRVERGGRGVGEHGADAVVRRAGEREPLRRCSGPPARRGSATARRAAAAGACRPPSRSPARRASPAPAPRRSRPRRRAPGSRGPPGRSPAARRPSAARRWSTRSARSSPGRAPRSPARRAAAGAPARAAPPRSVPSATTAPRSSSTRNVIRRWAGSRASSKSARVTRTPRSRPSSAATWSAKRPLRGLQRGQHLGGHLRHGHEPAPRVLGQRADQRGDQLLAEGRHEPVEARLAQLREHLQRHVDGDAVVLGARLEAVATAAAPARPASTPTAGPRPCPPRRRRRAARACT